MTFGSRSPNEVHHAHPRAKGGRTNADELYFACGGDHTDTTEGRQQTTVTKTGRLAWTDGTKAPDINHAHHPEELLQNNPYPPNDRRTPTLTDITERSDGRE